MSRIFDKLNLKTETDIVVLNAPESFEPELQGLKGIQVRRALAKVRSLRFALAFVTKQAELNTISKALAAKAEGDATLWFAYPKQSSKRLSCEFNRDSGWDVMVAAGYETVRMVAIDEDWSALRFRKNEFVKTTLRKTPSKASTLGKRSIR